MISVWHNLEECEAKYTVSAAHIRILDYVMYRDYVEIASMVNDSCSSEGISSLASFNTYII